jgi:hypothetical protein
MKWVVGDAVAGAQHQAVRRTIGEADPRGETAFADGDPTILRGTADAADQDLIRIRIVALNASVRTSGNGEILPAHAVVERELGRYVPAVTDVDAI